MERGEAVQYREEEGDLNAQFEVSNGHWKCQMRKNVAHWEYEQGVQNVVMCGEVEWKVGRGSEL